MTQAFFLQTKKGHGFSRFSGKRNAVCYACRSCGSTSAPQVCPIFLPLIYPTTRSTLRDNRVQRERWGNYTIFTLKAAKRAPPFACFVGTASEPLLYRSVTLLFLSGKLFYQGLSAHVSDNRSLHVSCHSYYCKEKRHLFYYNYQVIYIFLLCIIKYYIVYLIYKPMTS